MNLSERLGQEANPPRHGRRHVPARETEQQRPDDPLAELKQRAQDTLFATMGSALEGDELSSTEIRREVNRELDSIIAGEGRLLSASERGEVVGDVADNLLGMGPIQALIDDPSITEIMVNKPDEVYIERDGKLELSTLRFSDTTHIRTIIERIVHRIGRRIDESAPMVDARLPDGSRVNAVLPPLAIDSPTLTIRKFSQDNLTLEDLVGRGTLSPQASEMLRTCVAGRANIVISGGTGSGKTTFLNALSSSIPAGERIITIEDTAELRLQQQHVVRMERRGANVEGAGAVEIRDLVVNALRMRPDRIIIGECRGPEALDMLQAMNTGHEGSLTTLHANSPRDAIARLETMVLTAGADLPHRAIREQVASAIDIVVQLSRLGDGSRRVVQISELNGAESGVVEINTIYDFDWAAGRDETTGRYLGALVPTGLRPGLSERLENVGIDLPHDLFAP